jgi:FixJ family two-component response regulator
MACVVVDDDPRIRESLQNLFDSVLIEAAFYSSAEEFLAEHELQCARCLITDVWMPGISGYELQEHLIRRGLDIPIIFISAHPDNKKQEEANAKGALALLHKPFDGEELLEWVFKAMPEKREGPSNRPS